jgi:hypothetical protein
MGQKVGESALEAIPWLAARFVKGKFSLVEDERAGAEFQDTRNMV